jgi:hypothetical protein
MNKEKATLLADFIEMAGRYLEGGADNPNFKPIVAWALQNIPYLDRELSNEANTLGRYEAGRILEAATKNPEGEQRQEAIEKITNAMETDRIKAWLQATGQHISQKDSTKKELERHRKRFNDIPLKLREDVIEIIFHTRTGGDMLDYFKYLVDKKTKYWRKGKR